MIEKVKRIQLEFSDLPSLWEGKKIILTEATTERAELRGKVRQEDGYMHSAARHRGFDITKPTTQPGRKNIRLSLEGKYIFL